MTTPYISIKWPALIVVGEKVTKDQAAEILVRTASWPVSSNAHKKDAEFNEAAGFPKEGLYSWDMNESAEAREARYSQIEARYEELGIVRRLHYLKNSQITSSWIGGPHGWCDWDGNICTHEYNIGKWPSLEDVTEEWEGIAKAFPFLTLRAQVLSTENVGDDSGEMGTPTAEWRVSGGKVELCWPTERLVPPAVVASATTQMLSRFHMWLDSDVREVGAALHDVERGVKLALERNRHE